MKKLLLCTANASISLMALAIGTAGVAQTSPAETQDPATATPAEEGTEVVITGIRASQARSVDIKRNADSVVEAISAQDIGKLPDVTISDSLQRIPGVQIRREAGEGGAVNVRGLPQVTTLMNGEAFLGANSITNVQPNFTDIPAQLFSGATVYKSPTAALIGAGLSGTINLGTRRPFDLKPGLTLAGAAEVQYGDKTKKWNPSANALVGYRGERFGVVLSAAYSDVTLSNSFRGISESGVALRNEFGAAGIPGDFASGNNGVNRGTPVRNAAGTLIGYDVNGDGDAKDAFITPQQQTAYVRLTDRQRLGLSGSFQFDISDALRLTADGFYTRQKQFTRTAGILVQPAENRGAVYLPGESRDTGATYQYRANAALPFQTYNIHTVQNYNYALPFFDSYTQMDKTIGQSQNYNVQLDWKPSETFKATVRGIYAKASRDYDSGYTQFSLSDGTQWAYSGVGNYPASMGGDRAFNPTGYRINTLPATFDYSGNAPVWSLPASVVTQAGDPARYALKTLSSNGNSEQRADMWAVRYDGVWSPSSDLEILSGLRYGKRSTEQYTFERVAPLYAGNTDHPGNPRGGCLARWLAFDVNLSNPSCQVRDAQGNAYTSGFVRSGTDAIFEGAVKPYVLPVAGLPTIYAYDPKKMDNVDAWLNKFYPGVVRNINPADSWNVDVKQITGYVEVRGKTELLGMPVSANGGVRIVNTRLNILQNILGVPQPYGVSGVDAGDFTTKRDFTDFLPAFNVAVDVTDKLRFRAAYSKTMTMLDLQQWGGGLNVGYGLIPGSNPQIFGPSGATARGNPDLDPWRARNMEASLEYYTGRSSLIALGVFKIDVASFIYDTAVIRSDIPDNDGVVRRDTPTNTIGQGLGGSLKGLEGSIRQAAADYGVDGFLGGFGFDANYTLSLGKTGQKDLTGKAQPFQDNSRHQVNAAVWYEKYGLQLRVAYNYRSKRLHSSNFGAVAGLAVYQQPTNYFDASISYDVTPNFSIYGQASNLTGETENYYATWTDQKLWENIYERRFMAGVRAKF